LKPNKKDNMKRIIRMLVITIFVIALPVLMQAQVNLRHPNNGNAPGANNNPVGGPGGLTGGPIDGGLNILLILAFGYGAKTFHGLKKKTEV
jgi:hypothetical protein